MAASMFLEMRVKPGEQRIHRLRPDQVFAQQPDRPRVNNQPMQVETGKAHETRPVPRSETHSANPPARTGFARQAP